MLVAFFITHPDVAIGARPALQHGRTELTVMLLFDVSGEPFDHEDALLPDNTAHPLAPLGTPVM
jgi:hypothetical protein